MWDLISGAILRSLSFFAGFILRWYWTEKRLASRIKTTISSEHEGIRIDAGELPKFHAWIEVTNLSSFPVEVERLHGEVYYGARIASFIWLDRVDVAPASEQKILISADLTDAQVRYLRRTHGSNKTRLLIDGYLACRVRGFHIFGRSIESSNVEIININVPAS